MLLHKEESHYIGGGPRPIWKAIARLTKAILVYLHMVTASIQTPEIELMARMLHIRPATLLNS